MPGYASYSSRSTVRPSAWSRTTPVNVHTAPSESRRTSVSSVRASSGSAVTRTCTRAATAPPATGGMKARESPSTTGRSHSAYTSLTATRRPLSAPSSRGATPTVAAQASTRRVPFHAIWARPYLGRTILLTAFQLLQTIGYYGFMHWLATLFVAKGFAPDDALAMQFAASLLAPVGSLLAVWSSERWHPHITYPSKRGCRGGNRGIHLILYPVSQGPAGPRLSI